MHLVWLYYRYIVMPSVTGSRY